MVVFVVVGVVVADDGSGVVCFVAGGGDGGFSVEGECVFCCCYHRWIGPLMTHGREPVLGFLLFVGEDRAGIPGFVSEDGVPIRVLIVEDAVTAVVVNAAAPCVELVRHVDQVEEFRVEVLEEELLFLGFGAVPVAELGGHGPGDGGWGGECEGFGGLDLGTLGACCAVGDQGAEGADFGVGFGSGGRDGVVVDG